VATAAIKDQKYFAETTEKVKKARGLLIEQLRDLGFDVPQSHANFILARCKNHKADIIFDKLKERRIYVRYFKLPDLDDKLRITVGTDEQNNILISALKEILSQETDSSA
jgi:histidinol-phosphate aminotransferase